LIFTSTSVCLNFMGIVAPAGLQPPQFSSDALPLRCTSLISGGRLRPLLSYMVSNERRPQIIPAWHKYGGCHGLHMWVEIEICFCRDTFRWIVASCNVPRQNATPIMTLPCWFIPLARPHRGSYRPKPQEGRRKRKEEKKAANLECPGMSAVQQTHALEGFRS
jgi:hypothetical protein